MEQKYQKNTFLDLLTYIKDFFVSILSSLLFLVGKKNKRKENLFLRSLDFVFFVWPKYFWKHPSFYKITIFLAFFIQYVFYMETKKHEKKK